MKIRGILFDLDGTLIDTIDLIIKAFEHSFAVCLNKEMPRKELVKYFGLPLRSAMRNYVAEEQVEDLCSAYREFNLQHHDELIRPFAGVTETLTALQQRGIKMAIVTSKKVPMAKRGLQCMQLESYMDAVIGCDICEYHKPHPEPMEKALLALGLQAEECLCIGDSPFDLQSGQAAGCYGTAAVRYTSFDWQQMIQEGKPDYILETLTDLIPIVDDLNNKN
ncbi:pyrophosphatase PpaX [Phascolarctobacterium sp.]|uniref:pyrophosphatase PpaX n=1 Tax=Phascolarctobacterium sp. TaxID=2049039 RepID=UPI0015AD77E7|nr:pyrophosphatase PpaX [uncultured Phascolarctobacterium sp.]